MKEITLDGLREYFETIKRDAFCFDGRLPAVTFNGHTIRDERNSTAHGVTIDNHLLWLCFDFGTDDGIMDSIEYALLEVQQPKKDFFEELKEN